MLTHADVCSGKRACGLWDANEKLALARTLKDEVLTKAVQLFLVY
jgi:hypothetical protein